MWYRVLGFNRHYLGGALTNITNMSEYYHHYLGGALTNITNISEYYRHWLESTVRNITNYSEYYDHYLVGAVTNTTNITNISNISECYRRYLDGAHFLNYLKCNEYQIIHTGYCRKYLEKKQYCRAHFLLELKLAIGPHCIDI